MSNLARTPEARNTINTVRLEKGDQHGIARPLPPKENGSYLRAYDRLKDEHAETLRELANV